LKPVSYSDLLFSHGDEAEMSLGNVDVLKRNCTNLRKDEAQFILAAVKNSIPTHVYIFLIFTSLTCGRYY
jgi:hypothetical protein